MLKENCSKYYLSKAIDNLADINITLRTVIVHTCIKGCISYYRDKAYLNFCPECAECRWKQCTENCYTNDLKTCDHSQSPCRKLYYNVVKDRLLKVLRSDLRRLLQYEEYMAG